MNHIILAYKKANNYYAYRGYNKNPLIISDDYKQQTVQIFPYTTFTSLDKQSDFKPCYLLVDIALTLSEQRNLQSSGLMYYQMEKKNVRFIKEIFDPIEQYYLEYLKRPKKVGLYNATTWLIHQSANEREQSFMCKSLELAVQENLKQKNRYLLDLSFDSYVAQYLPFLIELSEKYEQFPFTFGHYGSNNISLVELQDLELTEQEFLFCTKHISNLNRNVYWWQHPLFTQEFHEKYFNKQDLSDYLINNLYDQTYVKQFFEDCPLFDKNYLFGQVFHFYSLSCTQEYGKSLKDFSNDTDYEPYIETESPYDYYCCEDCDGYDIHELYDLDELEEIETVVDDRVNELAKVLGLFADYLDELDLSCLNGFNKEVVTNAFEKIKELECI